MRDTHGMTSAIISAATSFLTFVLAQVFFFYSNRNAVMRAKLESLLSLYINISSSSKILDPGSDSEVHKEANALKFKYYHLMSEATVLQAIYFPHLHDFHEQIFSHAHKILNHYTAASDVAIKNPRDGFPRQSGRDLSTKVHELIAYAAENVDALTKSPRHFIRNVFW